MWILAATSVGQARKWRNSRWIERKHGGILLWRRKARCSGWGLGLVAVLADSLRSYFSGRREYKVLDFQLIWVIKSTQLRIEAAVPQTAT